MSYFRKCSTPNKDNDVTGEGVEGKFCKITTAMSEKLRGEWKLHMGEHSAKFNLKMEEDISNITISFEADKVILSQSVNVTCKVSGGVPKPNASDVTFKLKDKENKIVEGSEDRFSKEIYVSAGTGEEVEVIN